MRRRTFSVDKNGCWIAAGRTDKDGYCRAWDKSTKRNSFAHRLAYISQNGEIPAGLVVNHMCRVRRCINPGHLQLVTPTENTRLGIIPKLSKEKVAQAKRLYAEGLTQSAIAEQFDVNQAQVSRLLNGKAWLYV